MRSSSAEERLRHPAEIPDPLVPILHVVRNAVRKDVIHLGLGHAEAVLFEQTPARGARITVRDRAAGSALPSYRQSAGRASRTAPCRTRTGSTSTFQDHRLYTMILTVLSGVTYLRICSMHALRMRRVVNDAEGIDQIVFLHRHVVAKILGVGLEEPDAVFQSEYLPRAGAPLRATSPSRSTAGDLRAMAGEVDGARADAAADFEHLLAVPALEFGESRNVRLDKILASFDFVEVLLACRPAWSNAGCCTDGNSSTR